MYTLWIHFIKDLCLARFEIYSSYKKNIYSKNFLDYAAPLINESKGLSKELSFLYKLELNIRPRLARQTGKIKSIFILFLMIYTVK